MNDFNIQKTNYKRKNRYRYLALVLLVIVLALILYFYAGRNTSPKNPPPLPVETAIATEAPLERTIAAIGTLQANEAIIVRPEVSGRITEILFKDGQAVVAGQPLIVLEDSIAKASLRESKAEFILRQTDFNRAQTLLQKGVGSVTDKDNALAKFEIAVASLETANANFQKMHILAPFEGWVGLRKISIGDFVSPGQELVNLLDLTPIKVDFRIPEIYLEKIKTGQTIEVTTDALPNQNFIGKIVAIDPQVDPIGHSILIRGIIENEDYILHPGLFVRLKLVLEKLDHVLFIPAEALMPQEQKQTVFRVEKDTVVLTEVIVGDRKENEVEIKQGLKPGDIVITAGQMKVSPGTKVTSLPSKKQRPILEEELKNKPQPQNEQP